MSSVEESTEVSGVVGSGRRSGATLPPSGAVVGPAGALVRYSWVILGISLLVQSSATLSSQAIAPLAPFFLETLQLSRAEIGLLSSALFGGTFLSMPIAGRMTDVFGVRRMFVSGLIVSTLFVFLAGLSGWFWLLLVWLFGAGLGTGAALPATTRSVMFWFPQRIRGIAMSVKQMGLPLAGALAGLAVPVLALRFGWQGGLIAVAVATLIVAGVALAAYRESAAERQSRFGSAVRSGRTLDLLRHRGFLLLSLAGALYSAVHIATVSFLVLFLQEAHSLDVVAAGGLMALAQMSALIARLGWGAASDFLFGGRRKIVLGAIGAGSVVALSLLAWLPAGLPSWSLSLLMVLTGATVIGWNGINMTYVAELAGHERSATGAGLNQAFAVLATMIGPPVVGLIVDRTNSYAIAFQALAFLMIVAVGLLSQVSSASEEAARTGQPLCRDRSFRQ